MGYFECIVGNGGGQTDIPLIVTCDAAFAGLTITASQTGQTSLTQTCPSTSPYQVVFHLPTDGTWTISGTISGQTYSESITISAYELSLIAGFNWRSWVDASVDLDSTDYADLDEVLADEKAVRELMLVHACVDILADVASADADVVKIINNDICAKWINLSDYALDTLYANAAIAAEMDTADKYGYGEWVLKNSVPIMTSATTPSGVVSADSYDSGNVPYYAFDGNNTTYWYASDTLASGLTEHYVQYDFGAKKSIKKAKVLISGHSITDYTYSYVFYGSDDGTTFTPIASGTTPSVNLNTNYTINEVLDSDYRYYRFGIKCSSSDYITATIKSLELLVYGPKGNVPVMTSNSAPYGTASGTNIYSGDYYKAFDNDDTTYSGFPSGTSRLVYKFANPINPKRIVVWNNQSSASDVSSYKVIASNDGSTFDTIDTFSEGIATKRTHNLETDNYYLYVGIEITASSMGAYVSTLQFYGRELSVSVPVMTSNTVPYGVASCYKLNTSSGDGYIAFDGNDSTYIDQFYGVAGTITDQWVQFEFPSEVSVKMVRTLEYSGIGAWGTLTSYKLQTSNNNVIEDVETFDNLSGADQIVSVSQNKSGIKWRVQCLSSSKSPAAVGFKTIQFYGLDYSEKEFEQNSGKKWLYDHGVELETLTSGGSGTATKGGSALHIEVPATASITSFFMAQLDLTPYELYRGKVGDVLEGANTFNFGLYSALPSTPTTAAAASNYAGGNTALPNNINLDISAYDQTYYIGIEMQNGSSGPVAKKAEITELWLEP